MAPAVKLAYAMRQVKSGYNTVVEMVMNYPDNPQIGAYLFDDGGRLVLLENYKHKGRKELRRLIDDSIRRGDSSYSAFRIIYEIDALERRARAYSAGTE